ncbi:MAG: DMT family transporter [Hyphomicrobiaceae bacterium]|nr:DMT family transporter [Hyphomicrobiaceae bacterium]
MNDNPQTSQAQGASSTDPALLLPFVALILGAIGTGASPIFVRLTDVGPFASAFWRMALALPVLWAWLQIESARGRTTPIDFRADAPLIILLGFLFAGDLFFWHLSIMNTSITNATLLATTTPLVVALGAWLFLKERITFKIMVGVIAGVLGAVLLMGASATFSPENLFGDVAGFITAFFFGSYFLAVVFARRHMSAAQVMFYPAIVSACFLFIAAFLLDDHIVPRTWEGFGWLVALTVISQLGGQGFVAYALGHLPAVFSSLVLFLEALSAAFLAWLVFSEPITVWQLCGGVLILAGIYAARPGRNKTAVHS